MLAYRIRQKASYLYVGHTIKYIHGVTDISQLKRKRCKMCKQSHHKNILIIYSPYRRKFKLVHYNVKRKEDQKDANTELN